MVGCHEIFLIGAKCTKTAKGRRSLRDQIQTVVGIESFLVATNVQSSLKAIVEMPSRDCASLALEGWTVGNEIG